MSWHVVTRFDEIEDPGARGFVAGPDDAPLFGFVVRRGDELYGYVNVCPHMGRPLNWKPDAFLTRDRTLIICSAHGATFEIATGLCIAGPCPGASLRPLATRIVDGDIQVQDR